MQMPMSTSVAAASASTLAPSPPGLTDQHIWRCVYDGAHALSYIHQRGLVHNDIKPSNFYLGALPDDASQYRLLLGDFGQMTEAGGLEDGDEGDAVYMDRQVLNGVCDPTCDMFSFGLSIYEVAAQVLLPENGVMWHQVS
jgi:mitosis inhibitor protein kinase SWE1